MHMLRNACAQIGDDLAWTKNGGEPPKLVIYYLGILDTVASVGFGGSFVESIARRTAPYILGPAFGNLIVSGLAIADEGGHYGWARDISIPKCVRHCDHFIAAHEVREKFPSDSTRVDRQIPSNVREMLYPGMHSDVGGGYERNYQEGRTNMLANIALCNLYFSAYSHGVSFKTPEQIQADVGALFEISEDLQNVFNHYWKLVPNYDTLEEGIISHMQLYYHWRWGRTSRLKSESFAPSGGVNKWMKITDEEWEDDVVSIAKSKTGYFRSAVKPFEEEIFKAWKGELRKKLPQEKLKLFDLFFDKYVHDSIAGFKNQMSDGYMGWAEQSRWAKNRVYFLGRNPGKKYIFWQYAKWSTQYSDAKVQVTLAPNQDTLAPNQGIPATA